MPYRGNSETGRFCTDGCTSFAEAKVALESPRQGLLKGYLPCLRCGPMTAGFDTPGAVETLLNEMAKNTTIAVKDCVVKDRGVDPGELGRWFNNFHQMTFQDYLRLQRVNSLFGAHQLADEQRVKRHNPATISVMRIDTPLGPMLVGTSTSGVCLLEFIERRMLEKQLRRLETWFGSPADVGESLFSDQLKTELDEYFSGSRKSFSVPLDVPGTPFQTRAWDALVEIPYGETRSYQDQAIAIGQPAAVRAVARANGDNRIAIVIPCHRVIGKDGSLTGYGGKLWRKQALLDLEGSGANQGALFP